MSKKTLFIALVFVVGIAAVVTTAVAAPLPDGTKLSVVPGVGSDTNIPCATGSCFSMDVAPGTIIWTDFGPGTDGGFILGKDQVSGGQETGPSGAITTPGELSTAWDFFGSFGVFTTTPYPLLSLPVGASANLFDDDPAGCTLGGCIGKTELNGWYVAWNGGVYAMGSGYTCDAAATPSCTANHVAGISIEYYTIDPVDGGAWSIYHTWVVPNDPPSGFNNVSYGVIMRGIVDIPEPCTVLTEAVDCDDNVDCTVDTCDPISLTCLNTDNCDDNSMCTTDTCNETTGTCDYTPISCDDSNPCTEDTCDPVTVCVHTTIPCMDPPVLVSPADGQTGFGSSVEFRWKMTTGAASYQFHNCANDPTASCNPETVTAQLNSRGIFYAGGAGLFLIGMTFIGGLKGRKMMVLLFVMTIMFAGGTLISCSGDDSDSQSPPPAADEVQHFATGLSPSTTYYWKVVADDGNGNTATSEVRSFTTQ